MGTMSGFLRLECDKKFHQVGEDIWSFAKYQPCAWKKCPFGGEVHNNSESLLKGKKFYQAGASEQTFKWYHDECVPKNVCNRNGLKFQAYRRGEEDKLISCEGCQTVFSLESIDMYYNTTNSSSLLFAQMPKYYQRNPPGVEDEEKEVICPCCQKIIINLTSEKDEEEFLLSKLKELEELANFMQTFSRNSEEGSD